MQATHLLPFLLVIATAFGQTGTKQQPPVKLGVNLISNPGAEAVDDDNRPIGWKTDPAGTDFVDRYGHSSGEWDYDCTNCGLPPHAGNNYFRAAADMADGQQHRSLTQRIDLTALKDSIKTGKVRFTLSAQMAGFRCDEPFTCAFGYLKIEFFNSSDSLLKSSIVKRTMNEFHRVDDGPEGDSRMHQFQPATWRAACRRVPSMRV